MGQHHITLTARGKNLTVVMGWDRMLHGYFCVVYDKQEGPLNSSYSNLEDLELLPQHGLSTDLGYFLEKLSQLGLCLPEAMTEALYLDAVFDEGGRSVFYRSDGVREKVVGTDGALKNNKTLIE